LHNAVKVRRGAHDPQRTGDDRLVRLAGGCNDGLGGGIWEEGERFRNCLERGPVCMRVAANVRPPRTHVPQEGGCSAGATGGFTVKAVGPAAPCQAPAHLHNARRAEHPLRLLSAPLHQGVQHRSGAESQVVVSAAEGGRQSLQRRARQVQQSGHQGAVMVCQLCQQP
jgi:hypothetical protein